MAHAEQSADSPDRAIHGAQLWVAQPESTRFGEPAFEHHASLPHVEVGRSEATVLVGSFDGATSSARIDTPMMGVQATIRGSFEAGLDPAFEHAVVVIDGSLTIDGQALADHDTAYLPAGRDELALWADVVGEGVAPRR